MTTINISVESGGVTIKTLTANGDPAGVKDIGVGPGESAVVVISADQKILITG